MADLPPPSRRSRPAESSLAAELAARLAMLGVGAVALGSRGAAQRVLIKAKRT